MLISSLKKNQLLLMLIILLALILRLYNLGKQSLWLDEAYSVVLSSDLTNLWAEQVEDSSPPLYYSILHFWISFFGKTEFSLRLLSSLFGMLLVPLVYIVGTNIFDRKTGIFASLFVAMSPCHIYYSQEARAYSLLVLLSLTSFFMLYLSIKKNKSIFWIAYVLSTILCLYTHNYGILLLVAEICFFIFSCHNRYTLPNFVFSQICILIVFLPRVLVLSKQAIINMTPWISTPQVRDLILTFNHFCLLSWRLPMTPLSSLALKLAIPLFAIIFIIGLLSRRKENLFLLAYFFVPLGMAFLVSLKKPIYVAGRYDMLVFPAFCLIISVGLSKIKTYFFQYVLLILIIIATLSSLFNYYFIYRKSNDRLVSGYVQDYSDKEDIIVATELSMVSFEYYWKQDFQPQLFQFPTGPKSALVKEALAGEEEYINSEIRKLTETIYPLLYRGNKLWLLYQPFAFSNKLVETLEKEFENIEVINFLKGDNLNQISKIYIFKKR